MKKKLKKLYKSDSFKITASLLLFSSGLLFGIFGIKIPSLVLYILALIVAGGEVFVDAVKGLLRLDPLDEKFLMSIAAIGAMIVGEWSEGAAVMIFYLVGESFEHRAVRKSRASVKSLMDICPDEANVIRDGKPLFPGTTVIETEAGMKIGFFGMETPETASKVNPP